MALRGAATAASTFARQRSHPSLLPLPQNLRLKLHQSPSSHPLPGLFTSQPSCKTGFRGQIRAVHEATADPVTSNKENCDQSPENWKIKMLYDGDCPLCMREVNMLRERNKSYLTIKFIDISSDDYSPEENQGLDYKTAMGRIHAILSDGTVVTDVEAFRKLYENVGLGWVYAVTKYEPIGRMADAIYSVWAKYRLQITGRPPLEDVLEARRKQGEMCKEGGACKK